MSGTEHGVTLGTPIALFVPNANVRPQDYAEMSEVPRPGHADYTYQAKYGIRASSGGGRASARETIGRVAAGAIAEKWLGETYGTSIVTFVSAIGTVQLAPEHMAAAGGRPWTREEVDRLGTLTILRDARSGWAPPAEGAAPDAARVTADEAAFVLAYNATSRDARAQLDLMREFAAPTDRGGGGAVGSAEVTSREAGGPHPSGAAEAYAPGTPAYEAADGAVYDMHGELLPGCVASVLTRTDDIVTVRCPHAPTAVRMASLIRAVRAAEDSTGGVLSTVATRVPVGLGEPCFDKVQVRRREGSSEASRGWRQQCCLFVGHKNPRQVRYVHRTIDAPVCRPSSRMPC